MTFTSNTIQANGIAQHYYRSGGDKPPLVMLHGFTDDGACWFPVAEPLAQDYDVILPDMRGHGKSARVAGIGFRSESLAEDAAALIQALGLSRPAVVGHSLGGLVSLLLAAAHPEQVACLLLEDPLLPQASTPEIEAAHSVRMRDWANHVRQMQAQPREALIADERSRSPRWSAAELPPWADSKYQVDLAVFEQPWSHPQWQPLMQQVQCPVLLLYGEEGAIVNEMMAQEAAAIWKDGQAVQIANTGHCIRRDNADEFLRTVRAFLRQQYAG